MKTGLIVKADRLNLETGFPLMVDADLAITYDGKDIYLSAEGSVDLFRVSLEDLEEENWE